MQDDIKIAKKPIAKVSKCWETWFAYKIKIQDEEVKMNTIERRVLFSPEHDTVWEIDTLDEYTSREIFDCWYTKKELNKITVRCYKQAAEWEAGTSSKSYSFHRGLEVYTSKGEGIITGAIERCVDAVMDEQEAQWKVEMDDYDRIAAVSKEVSSLSVALALKQAVADEEEAQRIYHRMEKKIKKAQASKRDPNKVFKEMVASKPVEEGDDHTSVCSDLSHPAAKSSSDFEQAQAIPVKEAHAKKWGLKALVWSKLPRSGACHAA